MKQNGRRDPFWQRLAGRNPNPVSRLFASRRWHFAKGIAGRWGSGIVPRPRIVLVAICLFLVGMPASFFFSGSHPCDLLGSAGRPFCALQDGSFLEDANLPPPRKLGDDELASFAVASDILRQPRTQSANPKIAFLFLTPGTLPHQPLWEEFFKGHESMYSIFVHSSEEDNSTEDNGTSSIFRDRQLPPKKVDWGTIDFIDAERRLLSHAIMDVDNEYFVLISDSCIPLQNFYYIYNHFINTNISFMDCFEDPGPHGSGRYVDTMLPEVRKLDFRKGAQWFALNRRHALLVLADSLYYNKFLKFCKPEEEFHNCYPDEHYLQTFLHMMDPMGISNWSVTYVDWSERKWHPRSYLKEDITLSNLRAIQMIDESVHVTSDAESIETRTPCLWNGEKKPCYLFARQFCPDTTEPLLTIFESLTNI